MRIDAGFLVATTPCSIFAYARDHAHAQEQVHD